MLLQSFSDHVLCYVQSSPTCVITPSFSVKPRSRFIPPACNCEWLLSGFGEFDVCLLLIRGPRMAGSCAWVLVAASVVGNPNVGKCQPYIFVL